LTEQNFSTNLSDIQRILSAAHFAAVHHANQRRKGLAGEPYINHLIEVADLVASSLTEADANLIIAAFLHDVVEDTPTTNPEVAERFGPDVAALVGEVTDDKSLPKAERKRLQIESAPKKSKRTQSIKIADKISNLRAILDSPPTDWDVQRKKEYFVWAKQVVDGFTAPNEVLKAEFEKIFQEFDKRFLTDFQ
jgi:(p)ppGpp synthase/HD superfamily hydrolase